MKSSNVESTRDSFYSMTSSQYEEANERLTNIDNIENSVVCNNHDMVKNNFNWKISLLIAGLVFATALIAAAVLTATAVIPALPVLGIFASSAIYSLTATLLGLFSSLKLSSLLSNENSDLNNSQVRVIK